MHHTGQPGANLASQARSAGSPGGSARTPAGRIIAGALDLVFPPVCAGCGTEGDPLCGRCLPALLVRSDAPAGLPIGLPAAMPAPLLQLEWCAPFNGVVRRALHGLKYGGERRLAGPLGRAVGDRWLAAGAGGDLVVPVPVHAERARQRGFDQAALIAEVAAREIGVPMLLALERRRATEAQFSLGHDERAANVHNAFRVRREPGATDPVRDRWVVLVDDVITTGATLAACAEALIVGGAVAVSAVTVARER